MDNENEQQTIVVLGGYGAVGSVVCEELTRMFQGRVIIAGHNLQRAQLLTQRLGDRAESAQVNVTEPATYQELLKRASVVVNCVEDNNLTVAEQCLANSVHYVDISATAEVLGQLQTLDGAAKRASATVLYSVGVAPGLTNLLAHHAQSCMGPLRSVDIFVLLGLGESHGTAAIQWTLKQLGHKFSIKRGGGWQNVSAFNEGKATKMPEPFGRRRGYRLDISDQHTLPTTLGIDNVNTWLCFDSRVATKVFWLLAKTKLLSILPLWRWSGSIARLSRWVKMGGTKFVVQVDAVGSDGDERNFALVGDGEARMTGLVAAYVAEYLIRSSPPSGALHIEQLLNLETLLDALNDNLFLTTT